jgi:UDP-glucose 4-epimerase
MAQKEEAILVVGGAGYIGSHMVKMLLGRGYGLTALDNLSTGHRDAVLVGEFVLGDLADRALLDKLFSERKIGGVMHLDSFIQVGEPIRVPIDEAHPKNPINPYGRSTWMVEQMLADYDRAYALKSVSLRYFNVAGASAAFNLDYGNGFSVQEVIETAVGVTGKAIPVNDVARREGDAGRPEYDHLETIIRHAWQWEQQHK